MENQLSPNLAEFVADVNTPEKMQRHAEAVMAFAQRFNDGAPIETSSAADLKRLWVAMKQMHADHPPRPGVAIGSSILADYGIDFILDVGRFMPAQSRVQMLMALEERGVLDQFVRDGELDARVFEAAATFPIDKTNLAEASLPRMLAQAPPEIADKFRAEMAANGYDPERPEIDKKFQDWVVKHC